MHALSTSVCASCRSRKQKCDRLLPQCSRCERLLFKCHYPGISTPAPASIIPPSPSSSSSRRSLDGIHNEQEDLINKLIHFQNDGQGQALASSRLARLGAIMNRYKQYFDDMLDIFLFSCQGWLQIVHADDFRNRRVRISENNNGYIDKDLVVLILAMCTITRPLKRERFDGGSHDHHKAEADYEPDPLRDLMYVIAKQLFFYGDMVSSPTTLATPAAKPTLALIQAGLLLSVYEYGQGLPDSSYMTVSACSSMATLSGLWDGQHLPPLLVPGNATSGDEEIQTWWGIVVHERMISVKTGIPIRPLTSINAKEELPLNNVQFDAEIQAMMPHILQDRHYASYYLQTRAAIWLDLVLEMVQSNHKSGRKTRLSFQELDKGLLTFLSILVQLGMGTCCEAIAVALNAFFHLHKWRLSDSSQFTTTEKADSSHAIQTILKILSDISTDHIPGVIHRDEKEQLQANNKEKENMFIELFPYAVHMIYLILLEMQNYSRQSEQQQDTFAVEMRIMRQILDKQTERWRIAWDYIAILDGVKP